MWQASGTSAQQLIPETPSFFVIQIAFPLFSSIYFLMHPNFKPIGVKSGFEAYQVKLLLNRANCHLVCLPHSCLQVSHQRMPSRFISRCTWCLLRNAKWKWQHVSKAEMPVQQPSPWNRTCKSLQNTNVKWMNLFRWRALASLICMKSCGQKKFHW